MEKTRLESLTLGYSLDGGGYSFEEPEVSALKALGAVIWSDPDPDYIPWIIGEGCRGSEYWALSSPVYVFAPNTGHFSRTVWPSEYQEGDDIYTLVRQGVLTESDRECLCRADSKSKPNPDCPDCDGDGYVISEGGEWALYALKKE